MFLLKNYQYILTTYTYIFISGPVKTKGMLFRQTYVKEAREKLKQQKIGAEYMLIFVI